MRPWRTAKAVVTGNGVHAAAMGFALLTVTVQYPFHRDIDTLYAMALPLPPALDLPARQRLAQGRRDMDDFGQPWPGRDHPAAFGNAAVAPATAIGRLWVAGGSNLGAASLLKRAAAHTSSTTTATTRDSSISTR